MPSQSAVLETRDVFDELRAPEAVLERAVEIAHDMSTMPADAYRSIKEQVRRDAISRIRDVMEKGTDPMPGAWVSPQAAEASRRVLQRG
jgi:enoyl-CoA hydratase/carnithine racemase